MEINWKSIKKHTQDAVMILIAVCIGWVSHNLYEKTIPKQPKPNPYSQIYTPKQISVAVNESHDLLIIDKKTGDYIVYSDSVGYNIFKMYVNKFYQQQSQLIK